MLWQWISTLHHATDLVSVGAFLSLGRTDHDTHKTNEPFLDPLNYPHVFFLQLSMPIDIILSFMTLLSPSIGRIYSINSEWIDGWWTRYVCNNFQSVDNLLWHEETIRTFSIFIDWFPFPKVLCPVVKYTFKKINYFKIEVLFLYITTLSSCWHKILLSLLVVVWKVVVTYNSMRRKYPVFLVTPQFLKSSPSLDHGKAKIVKMW